MAGRRPACAPGCAALLALVVAALVCAGAAVATRPAVGAESSPESWTFVSVPDWLNADIADLSLATAEQAAGYVPGVTESTSAAWESAMDAVLSDVAAWDPVVVLVAGDLVNGHWHRDATGEAVFGPVATHDDRVAAIERAASVYYPQWRERFARYGLRRLRPAVGDHEIGDNNWGRPKARLVPTFKSAFADHFGGILGAGATINYLVGTVTGDRLDLELRVADVSQDPEAPVLWQAGNARPGSVVQVDTAGFHTAGTLTLEHADGRTVRTNRTGRFVPWDGISP